MKFGYAFLVTINTLERKQPPLLYQKAEWQMFYICTYKFFYHLLFSVILHRLLSFNSNAIFKKITWIIAMNAYDASYNYSVSRFFKL